MEYNVQMTMLALVAVAALALVLQTIFLIAILVIVRNAARSVREEFEHYRSSVTPVILKTRELVQNVAPKIEASADELAALSKSLRAQTSDISAAASDIVARAQHQVGRVDSMLTTVFNRVERAGAFMSDAVAKPMRQFSGVIASVKAVVETLRSSEAAHRPHQPPPYPDGEQKPHPAAGRDAYL